MGFHWIKILIILQEELLDSLELLYYSNEELGLLRMALSADLHQVRRNFIQDQYFLLSLELLLTYRTLQSF